MTRIALPTNGTSPGARPIPGAIGLIALAALVSTVQATRLLSGLGCAPRLAQASPADVALLIIAAPLLEECVMRHGLHETLLRWRERHRPAGARWPINLAVALAFAALHAGQGWQAALWLAPAALLLGELYQWRRDWRVCAAAHAFFNACALAACARTHYF